MPEPSSDRLERHSSFIMAATLIGHLGNYVFHLLTGRQLSEEDYGLMIALFGAANILVLPMSALQVSLSRAVASLHSQGKPEEVSGLLHTWLKRYLLFGCVGGLFALLSLPLLQHLFATDRTSLLMMAILIPLVNLTLTLTGSGLQGMQFFGALALRGGSLYILRALLIPIFLWMGFRSAGSGLLAHLLGMLAALGISFWGLRSLPNHQGSPSAAPSTPVFKGSLIAFPVLLSFSLLMTADVILIRSMASEELSGQFAQAATLARMVLWLPLPIAQVMFPKVVRQEHPTARQRRTLYKSMGYTLILVLVALGGLWVLGQDLFNLLFGRSPTLQQMSWMKGMGGCMALLGPVYVVLHYELARNRLALLYPLCAISLIYVGTAWFVKASPDQVIRFLLVAAGLALVTSVRALATERTPLSDL